MSLLTLFLANQGIKLIQSVGSQYLNSSQEAENAAKTLLPVVSAAIKKQTGSKQQLIDFLEKADRATLERYLNNPDAVETTSIIGDGESVLTNILKISGNRTSIISKLAANSGLPALAVSQLLPVVATIAVGALAKQVSPKEKANLRASLTSSTGGRVFGFVRGWFSRPSDTHYGKKILGTMIESGVSHEEKWVQDTFQSD